MRVRLVLAEDNVLVREGVRTLISLEDDLELVGVSDNLDDLLKLVEAETPDVVLTDIRMPPLAPTRVCALRFNCAARTPPSESSC